MEGYDMNPNNRNVKEKNLYLLQLNTPRVIILVSAIIGVIIVSFLIGMNFTKEDNSKKMSRGNIIIDEPKGLDLFKRNVPNLPDDGTARTQTPAAPC